ncbi:MAG: hypothetical protein C0501_23480 [Isosphaera sp.]|nr:hypothetical protein [Isosphaera sp.]
MHTIRLGPPWVVTPGPDRTTHARNFGRPRTLDPGERVWLVCARVPGPAEVALNGEPVGALPAAGPFAADVTDRLHPRNAVTFSVASDDPLGGVVLEVRPGGA